MLPILIESIEAAGRIKGCTFSLMLFFVTPPHHVVRGVSKTIIILKVHPLIRPATSILSMSIGSVVTVHLFRGPRKTTQQ
jgi:hypothetical protein